MIQAAPVPVPVAGDELYVVGAEPWVGGQGRKAVPRAGHPAGCHSARQPARAA